MLGRVKAILNKIGFTLDIEQVDKKYKKGGVEWTQVLEAAQEFPWFFELKLALIECAPSGLLSEKKRKQFAEDCLKLCDLWGTAWSDIIDHSDLRKRVEN
eukprot:3523769-Pyramimonas_sp.AAC.1